MKRVVGAVLAVGLVFGLFSLKEPRFSLSEVWCDEGFCRAEAVMPQGAATVVSRTYTGGTDVGGGVRVINESKVALDGDALSERALALRVSEAPSVLIYHTHTSEAYNDESILYYSKDPHSGDPSRNVVQIGSLMAQVLLDAGIGVVHVQQTHDDDFNRSYDRSKETILRYLEEYPTISVVLDVHRDSLIDSGGQKYAAVAEIGGEDVAQVMLLMGVGNDTYPHPNRMENLALAARVQIRANELYPNLMRPMLVRPSRYNQHLSTGAMLVEVGCCGNTPDQAQRAAVLFGQVLADVLKEVYDS